MEQNTEQPKRKFKLSFFGDKPGEINKPFFDSLKDTVMDSKPIQIATGIMNKLVTDPAIEALSKERMAVCRVCPIYNEQTGYCSRKRGGCGCDLNYKTRAPKEKCPKDKWLGVDITEYSNVYYKEHGV